MTNRKAQEIVLRRLWPKRHNGAWYRAAVREIVTTMKRNDSQLAPPTMGDTEDEKRRKEAYGA